MDNLIQEFNNTLMSFISFLSSLTNDSDLKIYRKIAENIINIQPNKLIEQYVIYCLPYYNKIITKDINFFLDKNYDEVEQQVRKNRVVVDDNDKNLFNSLKIKKIFPTLTPKVQNLICEYLILLSNYAKDYFNLRVNNKI